MVQIHRKITKVNFNNRNTAPKYIAIHYVGAVSTAANNATYFYSTYRGASANYFVDEKEIWQVVEDNDTAWAVGGSVYSGTKHPYYGIAKNSNTLSIEMCVKKKDGKWYYEPKTIEHTAWLVQQIMKKYNIPAKNVIRHYDVTGKPCPANYLDDNSWGKLHAQLTGQSGGVSVPDEKPSNSNGSLEKYSGYITVTYSGREGLSYHETPDWNSSSVAGTVKKGTVLTIKGRIMVDGTYMYQTKAGWYITSSSKYVEYTSSKPNGGSSSKPTTPSKPSGYDQWVADLQAELNKQGFRDSSGNKLVVDGLNGSKTLSACPTVKKGAKGNITKLIQKRLNSVGFSIDTDGIFGDNTHKAVKVFQKNRGLSQDGIVGRNSWKYLLSGKKY